MIDNIPWEIGLPIALVLWLWVLVPAWAAVLRDRRRARRENLPPKKVRRSYVEYEPYHGA